MLSFFLLATSLLSERMVSFDPLCGIAARKETMKLAGLRLRVIWTLPVFYYLDLRMIEIKNCARVCLFSFILKGYSTNSVRQRKEKIGYSTNALLHQKVWIP